MGRRGPVPAPDNVRALRGSKPLRNPDGSRARRLVLPPKAPAMPKLSTAAAAEWRRVVRELERAGVLAEVDRGVLVAYCTAWAHMMEAEAILREETVVTKGRDGGPVGHPAWRVYREANRTMLAAAAQLYITPVSRLRLPIGPGAVAINQGDGDDDGFD